MSKLPSLVADAFTISAAVFAFSKRSYEVFFEVHPRAVDDHLGSCCFLFVLGDVGRFDSLVTESNGMGGGFKLFLVYLGA